MRERLLSSPPSAAYLFTLSRPRQFRAHPPAETHGGEAQLVADSRNARDSRERRISVDDRHDRVDEGWPLARSFARLLSGGRIESPVSHLASHRNASPRLASPRSRIAAASAASRQEYRKGCVTHSTRASIARGCRRWQLSFSVFFPFTVRSVFLSHPSVC